MENGSDVATIEIKIRTMFCPQIPTLRIYKRVPVPALKEEVTLVTGVLAEHQHLIFRGKALGDDKLLSDYDVGDGDTLHLIVTSDPRGSSSGSSSERFPIITQIVSALVLSIGNAIDVEIGNEIWAEDEEEYVIREIRHRNSIIITLQSWFISSFGQSSGTTPSNSIEETNAVDDDEDNKSKDGEGSEEV